jgi:hypothetical protein
VKAKLRDDRRPAMRSNETWAMGFVHDQLTTGRKLRVLTTVDTFSRFSPALEPRFTFCGVDVVEVLEKVSPEVRGCKFTRPRILLMRSAARDLRSRAAPASSGHCRMRRIVGELLHPIAQLRSVHPEVFRRLHIQYAAILDLEDLARQDRAT